MQPTFSTERGRSAIRGPIRTRITIRLARKRLGHLREADEQVIDVATGIATVTRGDADARERAWVVVTDRRVVLRRRGRRGRKILEFPYAAVTEVNFVKGMASGYLMVRTTGATADIEHVARRDVERIARRIREHASARR